MLDRYGCAVSPVSRRKYVSAVSRFVSFSRGDFGHDALVAYVDHLRRQGYSPGTIKKFDLPAVRRFYRVNGIPWPLQAWEVPPLGEGDVYAPALSPELISRLIDAAKTKALPGDTALLALSTAYGLRRGEMCGLSPSDVDLDRGLIRIATLKGGRQRRHLVPQAIAPYLDRIPFGISPSQASRAFYRLEEAAGLRRMPEVGWHSIRRSLVRGLVQAGLPEPVIRDFLRWKRGTSSDMLLSYFSTQVVGEDGIRADISRRDEETDRMVFGVHPFLSMWEGSG